MIESQTPKQPERFDSPHGSGRGGQTGRDRTDYAHLIESTLRGGERSRRQHEVGLTLVDSSREVDEIREAADRVVAKVPEKARYVSADTLPVPQIDRNEMQKDFKFVVYVEPLSDRSLAVLRYILNVWQQAGGDVTDKSICNFHNGPYPPGAVSYARVFGLFDALTLGLPGKELELMNQGLFAETVASGNPDFLVRIATLLNKDMPRE
ncbi:hypothetical protein KBC79_00490 [Candidatus Woesebacteria bacterium]|nr:hypothetical protein [Candidatus Woesebacteria bacterium]